MMKIMLIAADDVAAYQDGSSKTYPKLGLISLVGYARRHLSQPDDFEFLYRDMLLERLGIADIEADIRARKPYVVGLSALSYNEDAFHAVAAAVRRGHPSALVVGGGPYVSSRRVAVLEDLNVDLLVFDEGERTFVALLEALTSGTPLEQIEGLGLRVDGGARENPARALIDPLDDIPLPAYDLIDFDAYARVNPHLASRGRFVPIVTSRGCPFRCIYCHALHGKRARFRSAESVLEEIEHLHNRYGVTLFYIYDDIFNLDRRRAKDICRGIVRRKLDIGIDFLNGLRGDMMDAELIELMLDAGTYYFAYAVETATPRLQDVIAKYNDLDALADTIQTTVRLGEGRSVVATYNMVGFPTETEDEVWNTIIYNLDLDHHLADVAVTIPQENTELYRMAIEAGFERSTTRTINYAGDIPFSASQYIPKARLAALIAQFKSAFYDARRRKQLSALAGLQGPLAQHRYLGDFLRGYFATSGGELTDMNAVLRAGMREAGGAPSYHGQQQ